MNPDRSTVIILAAVDRTPVSDSAIETACGLAASMRSAELHFVHVLAPPVFPSGPAIPPASTLVEDGQVFLAAVKQRAAELFAGSITAHLATGRAHEEILTVASNLDADLIVVGSHGRSGVARWVHRSVVQRVANDAPCAVLVARPKEHGAVVPEIEPACPDCLAVQQRTTGTELWCAAHAKRHPHGHLHYGGREPTFARGSMFVHGEG